jgi:hypothetical protein
MGCGATLKDCCFDRGKLIRWVSSSEQDARNFQAPHLAYQGRLPFTDKA